MSHPKLKGQRLGQVVWNALIKDCDNRPTTIDEYVGERLFYISDEDLTKLINDYLKEV
jgi:hypothetical protein